MKYRIVILIGILMLFGVLNSEPIRNFTLPDVNNQNVNIADHIGKGLIVIDFWASWCAPCMQLLPEIEKIHREYEDVKVITINIDRPRDVNKAKSLLRSQKYTFTTLFDTNQDVMKQFNVSSIPHTFLISLDGEIVYEHIGYTRGDEAKLTSEIEELLSLITKQEVEEKAVIEQECIEEK
ncbi:MAG: TlpA family protein disulfide reductase [Candidatus Cloacimonetes bacterium]|nr:TlpA family protein disulfide reductase [Candidatus Cloacimonadota bacterium]